MPDSLHPSAEPHDLFARRWLERISAHAREICILIVIVLGASVVYAVVSHVQEAGEQAAWEDLFRSTFEAGSQGDAKLADALQGVADRHRNTYAAAYALLRQMEERWTEGGLDKAEAAAGEFLRRFPDHPLASHVRLCRGQILIAKGAPQDAQREIEEALKTAPTHLEPEFRLAQAHSLAQQAEKATESEARRRMLEASREAYRKIENEGQARDWPPFFMGQAAFARLAAEDRLHALAVPPVGEAGGTMVPPAVSAPEAGKAGVPEKPSAAGEKAAAESGKDKAPASPVGE